MVEVAMQFSIIGYDQYANSKFLIQNSERGGGGWRNFTFRAFIKNRITFKYILKMGSTLPLKLYWTIVPYRQRIVFSLLLAFKMISTTSFSSRSVSVSHISKSIYDSQNHSTKKNGFSFLNYFIFWEESFVG